ncbi:universal stress protein [Streptomyces sp. NPDC057927]
MSIDAGNVREKGSTCGNGGDHCLSDRAEREMQRRQEARMPGVPVREWVRRLAAGRFPARAGGGSGCRGHAGVSPDGRRRTGRRRRQRLARRPRRAADRRPRRPLQRRPLQRRVLVAVLAWEPPEGEVLHARNPDSAWAARCAREAAARLDRAFEEAFGGTPSEVTVVRRVVRARPDRALCRLAAHPDDLPVIGARARARRVAVRRQVSAHARCPVLTVPAPAFARRERRALRRATARDFAAG